MLCICAAAVAPTSVSEDIDTGLYEEDSPVVIKSVAVSAAQPPVTSLPLNALSGMYASCFVFNALIMVLLILSASSTVEAMQPQKAKAAQFEEVDSKKQPLMEQELERQRLLLEENENRQREAKEKIERELSERQEREAIEKAARESREKADKEAKERAEREAAGYNLYICALYSYCYGVS